MSRSQERSIFITIRSRWIVDLIFIGMHQMALMESRSFSNQASSDGQDLLQLEALRGRSRSFAIGGTAWTVAIFRDRRHCVDGRDLSRSEALRGHIAIARSPSDRHDTPRSSRHLGDAWNSLDRSISIGRQRLSMTHGRGSRSRFDRGPIALRLGLICHGTEATINAE